MIVKIHKIEDGRILLAVCDEDLLGKSFEEKGIQLDLKSEFYKGKKIRREEVKRLFKIASIINLVGKESVELGVEEGIVDEKRIIKVRGIPHAQSIVIKED